MTRPIFLSKPFKTSAQSQKFKEFFLKTFFPSKFPSGPLEGSFGKPAKNFAKHPNKIRSESEEKKLINSSFTFFLR